MRPPSEPSVIELLLHPDAQVFERGLAALASRRAELLEDDIRLFTTICAALSVAQNLGPVEQDRRTALVLRRAPINPEFLRALGIAATDWSPHVRGAVVHFLPPAFKQLVYGKPSDVSSAKSQSGLATSPSTEPASPSPSTTTAGEEGRPVALLLGTAQEQESNRRLLEREEFRPCRASSLAEFNNLLTPDVSGIVVGRSWWAILPSDEHQPFIDQLFAYSSFAWIKIDIHGCRYAQQLIEICRAVRYRDPTVYELSPGETSRISEDVDLHALRRASALIDNATGVRLCPADIEPSQAQVLIGGIVEHVRSRHEPAAVQLQQIATSSMQGGLSQSLIIRAQPDDGGPPFIAKLAGRKLLRDEMDRFQRHIAPWDDILRPRLHFHGERAAIIFGLVSTSDDPSEPAPTLEDTLEAVLLSEAGGAHNDLPTEVDLLALIDRTIRKITSLNERQCTDRNLDSLAWMDVRPLDAMLERSIQWQFPRLPDGRHPLDMRHAAVERLRGMAHVATVHGDLHLRNVLVRERQPFLIDYAYTGPGHPCFDLVRFESALMYQVFRVTDDERSIQSLVRAVASESTTLAALRAQFPTLCASLANRVAIQASISARDGCSKLLKKYGGSFEQYLAMKFVVGCQSLCMQRLQGAVVRATVFAVAQHLAEHI